MNILFLGDLFGKAGRKLLAQKFEDLVLRYHIEFSVVNVENAAGGHGITPAVADELLALGFQVLTSGNHIWDKKEILDYLPLQPRLLRPANYPPATPGYGSYMGVSSSGIKVAVLNLQGRIFMPVTDCPFRVGDQEVARLRRETPVILVDMHGEATSEKEAMGWYLDGRVSAVLGTHTHVQTADERILPKGTAYITDLGMCGPYHSVIGNRTDEALRRLLLQMPVRFEPAHEDPKLCGVVLQVEEETGRAQSIHRLQVSP
ncbi:MAG: TIGR00282 family metallophosphoesterase [Acidobacteria bacterium]|nr:TIGR00282 family metallophosphoesterase [Acidobacteriota bacterium]